MGKRILICEDDEAILEMIKIMLENGGYQVKPLSNGKSIERKVKEYLPDLILIDIWMPGINGKEVIKLLKRDQSIQKIPVIIISAISEDEINQIIKELGAQGFLSKPFDMTDLLATVKKYTSKRLPLNLA